jgi:hypothetical protein
MSGAFVVVGAVFLGCTPAKLPSSELVHHFLALPPGTHGFAGSEPPSQVGCAGQTFIHLIEATDHKEARTPTKPTFVGVLAFNIFCCSHIMTPMTFSDSLIGVAEDPIDAIFVFHAAPLGHPRGRNLFIRKQQLEFFDVVRDRFCRPLPFLANRAIDGLDAIKSHR